MPEDDLEYSRHLKALKKAKSAANWRLLGAIVDVVGILVGLYFIFASSALSWKLLGVVFCVDGIVGSHRRVRSDDKVDEVLEEAKEFIEKKRRRL